MLGIIVIFDVALPPVFGSVTQFFGWGFFYMPNVKLVFLWTVHFVKTIRLPATRLSFCIQDKCLQIKKNSLKHHVTGILIVT